jgi:hypothetical protein
MIRAPNALRLAYKYRRNKDMKKVIVWTVLFFIKTVPENPVLWTGMKGASAKGRKNVI